MLKKRRHLLQQLQNAQVVPTDKVKAVEHEIALIEEMKTWEN